MPSETPIARSVFPVVSKVERPCADPSPPPSPEEVTDRWKVLGILLLVHNGLVDFLGHCSTMACSRSPSLGGDWARKLSLK